jgi:hypothetical protein
MTTKTTFTSLLALSLVVAGYAHAAKEKAPFNRVDVTFFEAEAFTDVKDTTFGTEKGRDATLKELRDFIVERAEKILPPGYTLAITVRDVDLAGEFEPWRGPRFDDVRIVKDIYPPRFTLAFRLTDEAGNLVKEGERKLSDLAFMSRISIHLRDPLRYEKEMLGDWIRQEFRQKK